MSEGEPARAIFDSIKDTDPDEQAVRNEFVSLVERSIKRSKSFYRDQTVRVFAGGDADQATELLDDVKVGIVCRPANYFEPLRTAGAGGVSDGSASERELEFHFPENDPFLESGETHYYQAMSPVSAHTLDAMRQRLYNDIRDLWNKGVNVICVNEIGYPPYVFSTHACGTQEERDDLDARNNQQWQENRQFEKRLQSLANGVEVDEEFKPVKEGQKCIIVAGTHHNPQTMRNKAVIFFPTEKSLDESRPMEHSKLTTAKTDSVGERIRTPPTNHYPLYTTHLGVVSVLVCLDAYDANMMLRKLQMAQADRKNIPIIIFVPAYSPASLVETCEDLSLASGAIVIHSNGHKNYTQSSVSICGQTDHYAQDPGAHVFELPHYEDINDDRADILGARAHVFERWQTSTHE